MVYLKSTTKPFHNDSVPLSTNVIYVYKYKNDFKMIDLISIVITHMSVKIYQRVFPWSSLSPSWCQCGVSVWWTWKYNKYVYKYILFKIEVNIIEYHWLNGYAFIYIWITVVFFCITSKSSFQYQYHVFESSYKAMKYVSLFLEL